MRISDWSSDVCSSDLYTAPRSSLRTGWCVSRVHHHQPRNRWKLGFKQSTLHHAHLACWSTTGLRRPVSIRSPTCSGPVPLSESQPVHHQPLYVGQAQATPVSLVRSEEHTSELQYLIRISYAVLRLTK